MVDKHQILCIGSVLWDIVGRTEIHPGVGGDVAGRIRRMPGGVALNIAMSLVQFGMRPVLLTAIGNDAEGRELVAAAKGMGLDCDHIYRDGDLPTDRYMAIESGDHGLVAAIADAHSLEAAGEKILTPVMNGVLGGKKSPFDGQIALDGNLTTDLLGEIAVHDAFQAADLRVAPASPGKANRLSVLFSHPNTTLYVNKGEAQTLCQRDFDTSADAATALTAMGVSRAMVSDGAELCALAEADDLCTANPPKVEVKRITGAGDTLMAGHIAAEAAGATGQPALEAALEAAAEYISRIEP